MRSRSNSGVRLDYYYRNVHKTILDHQNPVTGLLPAYPGFQHSWVRDNVYSILSVWGLSLAYRKHADLDEDRSKAYELEQSCVKLMRGLLRSMMMQKDKLEKFKETQKPIDALHAKYSSTTHLAVVPDGEWGHLQIDAYSLYLLILAQMTASGLQIIFNLDEVAFIQNLLFYIESAYFTPDYGIWERGDKTNHGLPELNASSIGMARAAMDAMNELDLFGARGGPASVIHVMVDETQKCQAVLHSMLPRESYSKEVDAALLSVITYPAFAVDETELIEVTKEKIITKLLGKYGCKRFLRDGYKTPREDSSRLYYEPSELRVFENIECEWPLFFCYLILDACFRGDEEKLDKYSKALDDILVKTDDGLKLVPEMYAVPEDKVEAEKREPHSQERKPVGRCPLMWAQSLYILGQLLTEGFIAPGELDPLNRRLCSIKKPDVVVQIAIVAEDDDIQDKLRAHDIYVQTNTEVAPIEVQPARVLSNIYAYLGYSDKLKLTGRKSKDIGMLSTSKCYNLQDRMIVFTPQFADLSRYYIASDIDLLLDTLRTEVAFLKSNWHMLGRPLVVLPITQALLDEGRIPASMVSMIRKLKGGYTYGTRVILGRISEFINTSCISNLSFLNNYEEGLPEAMIPQAQRYLEKELQKSFASSRAKISLMHSIKGRSKGRYSRRSSVTGVIRRSRSIRVNDDFSGLERRVPSPTEIHVSSESPESESRTRTPSPGASSEIADDEIEIYHHRTKSDTMYENTDEIELIVTLHETDNLEEQADILHFLVVTKGLDFEINFPDGTETNVRELLKEVYQKAIHEKAWALVRHISGMLGKKVEDLTKAVTDLLVRQKQVTVGNPPYNERTITRPLPSAELRRLIHQAYGDDESTAMLTQELIVYLAMFIRSEPHMFNEMIRLRVGLIIQVMASELAKTLYCPANDAAEFLLNLSPFEMKNLLYNIISGLEFGLQSDETVPKMVSIKTTTVPSVKKFQPRPDSHSRRKSFLEEQKKIVKDQLKMRKGSKKLSIAPVIPPSQLTTIEESKENLALETEAERHGQWIRRRKLDGALNRVPKDFYTKIYYLLEHVHSLKLADKIIPNTLTSEMTSEELKFALQVETVLNMIPQPEYRQLIVEALMVLSLAVENDVVRYLSKTIHVESIVQRANQIFLEDQRQIKGDATLCCANPIKGNQCNGAAGICQHLYDSAPSGSYGTMAYLIRAIATSLESRPTDGEVECIMS